MWHKKRRRKFSKKRSRKERLPKPARGKKEVVSEVGSSNGRVEIAETIVDIEARTNKALTDQILNDISQRDYLVWNSAYERGYRNGRDYEAKMHSDLTLSMHEVQAIKRFALSIGYISYENHEDFHMLLKRLEDI